MRKLIPAWTLVLTLLAALTVSAMAQDTPEEAKRRAAIEAERKDWVAFKATIKGTIVDDKGAPIDGARFSIFWPDNLDPNSSHRRDIDNQRDLGASEAGKFEFAFECKAPPALESITAQLTMRHNSYIPGSQRELKLKRDGNVELELVLKIGGAVTGTVTDADGKPVAGAHVFATYVYAHPEIERRAVGSHSARSGADGTYRIQGLVTADYSIRPWKAGYIGSSLLNTNHRVEADADPLKLDLTLAITHAVTMKLSCPGVALQGRVKCTFTTPEGEEIIWADLDADGKAVAHRPPLNATEVELQVPGYTAAVRRKVVVTEGRHTDLGEVSLEPGDAAEPEE